MKKPCFDWTERYIIKYYYDNPDEFNWWTKPGIISVYEFQKAWKVLIREFSETKFFKTIINLHRIN